MRKKKYKFMDLSKAASIPSPRELTSEEEAEILAQYKAQLDPIQLEAECRELLRLQEEGKLVSAERMLKDLDALDQEEKKESA